MNEGDLALFVVAAALGLNHVAMRIPGDKVRWWALIPVQLINMAATIFLLLRGIEGFHGSLKVINYVLALLLIVHMVKNNATIGKRKRKPVEANQAEAKTEQLMAALENGRQEPDDQ